MLLCRGGARCRITPMSLDIRWFERIPPARAHAARRGRLVLAFGLLNGTGRDDHW